MYCSVKNVQQLQMDIRAGIMRGRVHITQVLDKPLKVCVIVSDALIIGKISEIGLSATFLQHW